ncbi:MAG: magnesium chelatase [Acidobacteria bacterium]|nr:magnesium chelatase [Acidobacteriota bacterium]
MRPTSLGSLRRAVDKGRIPRRSVKRELRDNLMARLRSTGPLFPGIVGYDDSVVPQVVNAILSQHDFVMLGLRGQAKTRLIRGLAELLDESVPVVPGCGINCDPLAPICGACRARLREEGDDLPVAWLDRSMRYVEKLATPDVTIADMIGDIDPIKAAAEGRRLSDELTVHYGLVPRANRCIFAINELPDLAGKIQVGLFNILQEGDIQIRGYPVRLRLDVAMAFTANPEDYTARGKIVTPLKDRIGSEIRTHYPRTRHEAIAITEQEAWVARDAGTDVAVPLYVREVVEEIAFQARINKKIDGRSGVSQRMPITCLENVVSNAERRALASGEAPAARVTDVYAALPAMTGKFELEYEGELRGADAVGRELIRAAVGVVFGGWFDGVDTHQVVEWFEMGGTLQESDTTSSASFLADVAEIHGLLELAAHAGIAAGDPPAQIAAGVDFVLEGLCAQRKISRSDGGGYEAVEKPRTPVQPSEPDFDPRRPMPRAGNKKKYYN